MDFLFSSWSDLLRMIFVGVLAYVGLVTLVRIAGKRTLAKMNAFDFIVTVALGSTLATILLSKDVTLADGLLALVLLIGLQFMVAWLSVNSSWVESLVKSEPTLLLYQGKFLQAAMKRERVSHEEIEAAIREQGMAGPAEVAAVVLETNGTFSVISQTDAHQPFLLPGVKAPSLQEQAHLSDR